MNTREKVIGGVAILALILSLVGVGGKNQSSLEKKVDALTSAIEQVSFQVAGIQVQQSLGSSGTRFPNGISANSTSPVAGEILGTTFTGTTLTMSATSTLQERILGSRLGEALAMVAGNTTTPGGIASIENTGKSKICSGEYPKVYVTGITDSYVFDVSTSTTASVQSNFSGTLIASTTIATSSTRILDPQFAPGTFFGASAANGISTSTSWIWDNGVFVHVTMFPSGGPDHASSTAYTGTGSGFLFLDCLSF